MADAPKEQCNVCPQPANIIDHIAAFYLTKKRCNDHKGKKQEHDRYKNDKCVNAENDAEDFFEYFHKRLRNYNLQMIKPLAKAKGNSFLLKQREFIFAKAKGNSFLPTFGVIQKK